MEVNTDMNGWGEALLGALIQALRAGSSAEHINISHIALRYTATAYANQQLWIHQGLWGPPCLVRTWQRFGRRTGSRLAPWDPGSPRSGTLEPNWIGWKKARDTQTRGQFALIIVTGCEEGLLYFCIIIGQCGGLGGFLTDMKMNPLKDFGLKGLLNDLVVSRTIV